MAFRDARNKDSAVATFDAGRHKLPCEHELLCDAVRPANASIQIEAPETPRLGRQREGPALPHS